MALIDLDAARAERQRDTPDGGLTLQFKGENFELPVELPEDALDPILADELDLIGIIREVMRRRPEGTDWRDGGIVEYLLARPNLPRQAKDAIYGVFEAIFGPENWQAFLELRPSIPDLVALGRNLLQAYGVGLGEAFSSAEPSENSGGPSRPTSERTTTSTSAKPSARRASSRGSSASGA